MSIVMHVLLIRLPQFDTYLDHQVDSPDLCRISSPHQDLFHSNESNFLPQQNISKYHNQTS